jgi:hypothetical protein
MMPQKSRRFSQASVYLTEHFVIPKPLAAALARRERVEESAVAWVARTLPSTSSGQALSAAFDLS